jgi:hypothetical protein
MADSEDNWLVLAFFPLQNASREHGEELDGVRI